MKRRFFGQNKKRRDTSKNYFTIEVLEDGQLIKLSNYYEYCIDDEFWNKATPITYINANAGLLIYFKGNLIPSDFIGIGNFTITKKCNLSGNIMSLLYGDEFEGQTDLTGKDYAFFSLFSECSTIIDASQLVLPATTLARECYYYMFYGCTSLVTAPALPTTTLVNMCYSNMFSGCASLVTAPDLPAITLAPGCYQSMFYNCTSLVTPPELPATTLAQSCYSGMFYNCSSLVNAPELPAISLAPGCYDSMFHECRSLTQSPELPATTLADACYQRMFYNCTSLVTPPELPATTLAQSCYYSMFSGCASLVNAPELPAISLTYGCYYSMFSGCASLVTAPDLPAITLAPGCYHYMFYGCTSLVTAPALPTTTLVNMCYSNMFGNCTKLNYIKALFTTTPSITYTDSWVSGVSSTGTFIKNKNATWNVTGVNGIPTGWTVEIDGEENVNLITFYIDNIEYQAEEGMTWKEWVNSEYNTDGYVLYLSELGGDIYDSTGNMSVAFSYDTFFKGVKAFDLIESDYRYSLYLF